MKNYKILIKVKSIVVLLWVGVSLSSCGEIKRVDTQVVKEHMNDYKIKKADQSTIVLQAETWSQAITDTLRQKLEAKIASMPKTSDPASVCKLAQDAWVSQLQEKYAVEMELWGKNTQPQDLALPQEKELFAAYQYALEKGLPMESNLQKSGDSLFIFTRSIQGLAKACFGDSTNGLSLVRLKIPKASVVKTLPFRKK